MFFFNSLTLSTYISQNFNIRIMRKINIDLFSLRKLLVALSLPVFITYSPAQQTPTTTSSSTQVVSKISKANKINTTTVELVFENNQRMTLDFYGENIFRLFQDANGGILREPQANPPAQILVDQPRKKVQNLNITDSNNEIQISTNQLLVTADKNTNLLTIINKKTNQVAVQFVKPASFDEKSSTLYLKENPTEYFYGGGVQNGRFSHKGKAISIENQNSWTDGGVASPTPFYWSTNGYGMMWYSFKKGRYDFGLKDKGTVQLSHDENYIDVFFMLNETPIQLLNDFYQLTGNPVLMPKFSFYQGHLNAYNRDYWKEDQKGTLFEDGKRYKESQKDQTGIKESLNGELGNNYQFSARAVVDRYKKHDMPLGWVLPNDGYGAGYGQTSTLDGNIQNLKSFGDYARKNGVEIGLWTQSDLHPKDSVSALLQRDIVKEVRDAGVRVLKTDVAWVGPGYSFGLNGVSDVGHIMPYYGNNARPFIISLDGWAGTQRYAGIWSGDQTGGVWEYIRFHIPTYIGSGLSGQPNISSDMDGIFGGKNPIVNTRDFQWKTWTPMELNMDGWGSNEKYPHALGEPITSINRHYLKLKSELMPYAYSIAKESVDGMPMIRAMFLDDPNDYTLKHYTQYQFLYGPNFLVAPIYQATKSDDKGNDTRNGIYLPKGLWVDYFSGNQFEGGQIINNYDAPIWKLPVFVKRGAIIPMTNPNNNVTEIKNDLRIYDVYPLGKTSFVEYDDDGRTEAYRYGEGTKTEIISNLDKNKATLTIHKTSGNFDGFEKNKITEVRFNTTAQPKNVQAKIGGKKVSLKEVKTLQEFQSGTNVFFYDAQPNLNQFATANSEFSKVKIIKNPVINVRLAKTNIVDNLVEISVDGYQYNPVNPLLKNTGKLETPKQAEVTEINRKPYTLTPSWNKVDNADYYDVEFEGRNYTNITDQNLLFENLSPETSYSFKVRAVNKEGASDWATLTAETKDNPLLFAIKGVTAETSVESQGSEGVNKLFDYDEGNMWHTAYNSPNANPFEMIINLNSINQLDKFQYIPRNSGTNGNLIKGKIYSGLDKDNWIEAGTFEWKNNADIKEFVFAKHPTAKYIKIEVEKSTGGFGSGREMYIFKVPGTESYIPGDINNDRLVDMNDITSYTNYMGLRLGDSDFEGYVSNGDVNKNNLIDAYDISNVATRLRGGANKAKIEKVDGKLSISTAKQSYNAGEIIEIKVKGTDLKSVNALSFALPYNQSDYEFVSIQSLNTKEMENLSNDRLHTNGVKALYPAFINLGNKEAISGTQDLFIIKLKAKRNLKFNLKPIDGILVDKDLRTVQVFK